MATETSSRLAFVEGLVHKMTENLALLVDREIGVESITCETAAERPAGMGCIHISFKLGFTVNNKASHGCVLMPLPEAIALAGYLMMMPDADVEIHRSDTDLDQATKDALLELGNFIGGAADDVMRSYFAGSSVRSEGCQGVRADIRPALDYREGDELIVGRAQLRLHTFPDFELIAVLPAIAGLD